MPEIKNLNESPDPAIRQIVTEQGRLVSSAKTST